MRALFDITGRVALVTGGSSGVGLAIATALAGAGAATVLMARRQAPLNAAVATITRTGGLAGAVAAELGAFDSAEDAAKRAAEPFGSPDILVNAAGVNLREPIETVTSESWARTLAINLDTPFFLARALVPAMRRKRWGRIINIASLQSMRAFADSAPYGASKGGIVQLTRAMAEAWSADGITCNALAPGFFPTDLTAPVFENPERAAAMAARTAIGRNGAMEDLYGPAVFLAASASDYITGQTLFVDGGFTAK